MAEIFTSALPQTAPQKGLRKAGILSLRWTGFLLVATVWVSAGLFGLYILSFYAAAFYRGTLHKWNDVLPGLYNKGAAAATTGIGLHFAAGGVILVLGSLQLIEAIRVRYPAFHKWVGRVYVVASLVAALGGLTFIIIKGTIGGAVMNTGFALYGMLMFLCSLQTWRHAVAGCIPQHRAWALRLYALAIGSWLYRMDYGFWFLLADGAGHNNQFHGTFDYVMAFFFYLPNLLVAEIFIRERSRKTPAVANLVSAVVILLMTGFLLLGTYYFTRYYWGPAIVGLFSRS